MGLTRDSVGKNAAGLGLKIKKLAENDLTVAVAGNPNVGKSAVFNALTGMRQHTGNWPGKTVVTARGRFKGKTRSCVLVDIPGVYSLAARSEEEEVARDYLRFGSPDAVIVVCDAARLERNLSLVLQILEISENVIVCVNMMDEAGRKGITANLELLSERLGVPVVGTSAIKKKSLAPLKRELEKPFVGGRRFRPVYSEPIEKAIAEISSAISERIGDGPQSRRLAIELLDADESFKKEISARYGEDFLNFPETRLALAKAKNILADEGINPEKAGEIIVDDLARSAREICAGAVTGANGYAKTDRRLDKLFTSRTTGYPIMLLLLAFVFWLAITGANYPSKLLSDFLFGVQDKLSALFLRLGAPAPLHDSLVLGVYRVLAWVVSVMLPPTAIFFPLFSLLEDSGYLPRIAYNLDGPFKLCGSCGKQSLTMCMGFGCNAAGIIACRIIDSPREKLLAALTNSLVPCNGRFPTLILIITVFFVGTAGGALSSLLSALALTAIILLGILATFLSTKALSKTLFKGVPSSFVLELPPYRRPRLIKTLVRSIFDRVLFVLGRAAAAAAPAGLIIWLASNVYIGGITLLERFSLFIDPFARLMGLDGVILTAFILGLPANEITVPIMIAAYSSIGVLPDMGTVADIGALFIQNGWTRLTALCTILFSLMHWPCSTTLLTIKKETGSLKLTLLAAALPTAFGIIACMTTAAVARSAGFG